MLYLVAILLPPVAVLMAGKPGQALLNIVLTLLFYFPGLIHALLVVNNHYADKRTGRLEAAIRATAGAPVLGSIPVFPKPDLGARAIATLPADGFEAREVKGAFTRVTMTNGASGWVRTADIQR